MRVCNVLLNYHPSYSGRGAYWRGVLRRFGPDGPPTFIVANRAPGQPRVEYVEGVKVVRVRPAEGPLADLRFALRLFAVLWGHRGEFDILHVHALFDAYGLLALFCALAGKRQVFNMTLLHSDDPLTWRRVYRGWNLRRRWLERLDAGIAQSPPQRQSWLDAGLPPDRIHEIPNGVDDERFRPAADSEVKARLRECEQLPTTGPVACFVGAVIFRKGLDRLVAIWKELQARGLEIPCLIVGPTFPGDGEDGRFLAGLEREIAAHGLPIRFCGRQEDTVPYLQLSDLLVFPSRSEGFPNVVVEAMACGLPVLMSPLDGIAERMIRDGTDGWICDEVSVFADRIAALAADPELGRRLGAAGRRRVLAEFSLGTITGRILDVYRTVSGAS